MVSLIHSALHHTRRRTPRSGASIFVLDIIRSLPLESCEVPIAGSNGSLERHGVCGAGAGGGGETKQDGNAPRIGLLRTIDILLDAKCPREALELAVSLDQIVQHQMDPVHALAQRTNIVRETLERMYAAPSLWDAQVAGLPLLGLPAVSQSRSTRSAFASLGVWPRSNGVSAPMGPELVCYLCSIGRAWDIVAAVGEVPNGQHGHGSHGENDAPRTMLPGRLFCALGPTLQVLVLISDKTLLQQEWAVHELQSIVPLLLVPLSGDPTRTVGGPAHLGATEFGSIADVLSLALAEILTPLLPRTVSPVSAAQASEEGKRSVDVFRMFRPRDGVSSDTSRVAAGGPGEAEAGSNIDMTCVLAAAAGRPVAGSMQTVPPLFVKLVELLLTVWLAVINADDPSAADPAVPSIATGERGELIDASESSGDPASADDRLNTGVTARVAGGSGGESSVRVAMLQLDLEVCLDQWQRCYRPSTMLARCMDWNNWSAAALIAEHRGDWIEALTFRLRQLLMKRLPALDEQEILIGLLHSHAAFAFAKGSHPSAGTVITGAQDHVGISRTVLQDSDAVGSRRTIPPRSLRTANIAHLISFWHRRRHSGKTFGPLSLWGCFSCLRSECLCAVHQFIRL